MTTTRQRAIDRVRERGYEHRDVPFKLASGQTSHDYIDGKHAVDDGPSLLLVSRAIVELAEKRGMQFDAVGGLTMGADALAHGVAIVAERRWFSVRKQPKGRGLDQYIEGARLASRDRVLLVDDVVTSGGSILAAYKHVIGVGARVAGVIPLVDRGDHGRRIFQELGVSYEPLMDYKDLGIDPVRFDDRELAQAAG